MYLNCNYLSCTLQGSEHRQVINPNFIYNKEEQSGVVNLNNLI